MVTRKQSMQPQEIFYIVSTLALLLFLGIFTWIAVLLIKALYSVKHMLERVEAAANDLSVVKDSVKEA